ncbi:Inositol-1-monophosphatase [Entamoeba marina]
MSDSQLNTYFNTVLPLVKTSGRMIRDAYCKMQLTITGSDDHLFVTCNPTVPTTAIFEEVKTVENKSCSIDWVTETDKAVETYLIQSLKASFPTHKFVGEETTSSSEVTSAPTWIIDPIDGTTNFVHGIPMCCVSVALSIDNHVVIGIVYNPLQEELFTSIRGRGSYMNGKQIHVSQTSTINQAVIGTNPGYQRGDSAVNIMLHNLQSLLSRGVAGIKMLGNAAMDICYVACARTDAFYEKYLNVWDFAAAILIVEEAGGIVKTPNDIDPLALNRDLLIVGNKPIANQLKELLEN